MTAARSWTFGLSCLAAGALFFFSLPYLWPLAAIDRVASPAALEADARTFLEDRGFDLHGFAAATRLSLRDAELEYVERSFGRQQVQDWISAGLPLYEYLVSFKRRGDPAEYVVRLHPDAGVRGWQRTVEEDEPGPRLEAAAARALVLEALALRRDDVGSPFREVAASSKEAPDRRDHGFRFERTLSASPELRERVDVRVAGDRVVSLYPSLVVPAAAARAARTAEAPGRTLEMVGFVLLAAFGLVALAVFLTRLRDGEIDLRGALPWPLLVFVCLVATFALERAALFAFWEPLWPKAVSDFQYLVLRSGQIVWLALALLVVFAAGDAVDRASGGARGAALRALGRGKLGEPGIALASLRGFGVGLLCGGAMAACWWALDAAAGTETALQPRGFFFYTLNTASPAATSLLFFVGVALVEELGYRYFLGGWLLRRFGRRWIAVWLPALVYGLTHTRLDFLPTAEPFWARPLILTVVGAVWGWAFLRYGALCVVLSHFTADLFIFNWPRLASGEPRIVAASLATFTVPLLPAAWGIASSLRRRQPS